MKTSLLTMSVAFSVTQAISVAGIEGRVSLRGIPPPEIPIVMSPDCASAQQQKPTTRHYVVSSNSGLANVFVVVRSGLEGKTFPAPTNVVTMDCVACQTQPYVAAVQTGQPFRFQNDSSFQENLHFTSRLNREGNYALPSGAAHNRVFDTPEDFIRIKGDAHPWFFGYISVVGHPFFAVTGTDGKFKLPDGLPDGRYIVEAKHLKAGSAKVEVLVQNGRAAPIEFFLNVAAK